MKKNKSTDAHLVSAYMKGDELAISELITRHKQKIYSFIYSKVYDRDVSEDIFQDTFIKVINTHMRTIVSAALPTGSVLSFLVTHRRTFF